VRRRLSGNSVSYSNVRKTLTRRLIARAARSIEAYRNEHGNVAYVGGGSNPSLRTVVVCLGEDAEVTAGWVHALLSPTRSTLMPSDPFLTLVAEALAEEDHIQGFTYAGHCVIRNVAKRWAEQEARGGDGRRRADPHGAADRGRATEARVRRRLEAHRQPVPGDGGGGQGSAGGAPSSGGPPQ
jgi:hypothetical protein